MEVVFHAFWIDILLEHIVKDLSEFWFDQQTEHFERALIDSKSHYGLMSPGCAFLAITEKHWNTVFFESYADLKPTLDRVFAKLVRKQPERVQVFEDILLNRLLPALKQGDSPRIVSLIRELCHELESKYLESLERTR